MSGRSWIRQGVVSLSLGAWLATLATAQAPRPAAVVNGEAISAADLESVLKQSGPSPVEVPEAARKQVQMQALGMMIDELLIRQFLKQQGPQVTQAEVDQKLARLTAELKEQNKTITDFLRESGQTEAELRDDLTRLTQWMKYTSQKITDPDIQRYYTTYRDFFDGVTVRVSHIVLPVPPGAPEPEAAKAKATLEQIRTQIISGQVDFETAAKAHSQCPSAPKGGDLGYIPRKFAVDESFAQAAFALPVGQISNVIQTSFGLHLIKVTDRKAGQPSELAKVKDAVKSCLVEELRRSVLYRQHQAAKIEVNVH